MLTVTYNPNWGTGVPDGEVENVVDFIINSKSKFAVVSNQTVIDELRLRVCKGEINHKDICFNFAGKEITINEYGVSTTGYPKGFCDVNMRRIGNILRCALDKRKAMRKENTK